MRTFHLVLAACACLAASLIVELAQRPGEAVPRATLSATRGTWPGYQHYSILGHPLFTNCADRNRGLGLTSQTASCSDKPDQEPCISCPSDTVARYEYIVDQPAGNGTLQPAEEINCTGLVKVGVCLGGECTQLLTTVQSCEINVLDYEEQGPL